MQPVRKNPKRQAKSKSPTPVSKEPTSKAASSKASSASKQKQKQMPRSRTPKKMKKQKQAPRSRSHSPDDLRAKFIPNQQPIEPEDLSKKSNTLKSETDSALSDGSLTNRQKTVKTEHDSIHSDEISMINQTESSALTLQGGMPQPHHTRDVYLWDLQTKTDEQWLKHACTPPGLQPRKRYAIKENYFVATNPMCLIFQQQARFIQQYQLDHNTFNKAIVEAAKLRREKADTPSGIHVLGIQETDQGVQSVLLTLQDSQRNKLSLAMEATEFQTELWMALSALKEITLHKYFEPTAILLPDYVDDDSIHDYREENDIQAKIIHIYLQLLEWRNVKILSPKNGKWLEHELIISIHCTFHHEEVQEDLKDLVDELKFCAWCRKCLKPSRKRHNYMIHREELKRAPTLGKHKRKLGAAEEDCRATAFALFNCKSKLDEDEYTTLQMKKIEPSHKMHKDKNPTTIHKMDLCDSIRMANYYFGHNKGGIVINIPSAPPADSRTRRNKYAPRDGQDTIFISSTQLQKKNLITTTLRGEAINFKLEQVPLVQNLEETVEQIISKLDENKAEKEDITMIVATIACPAFTQATLLETAKQILELLDLHGKNIFLVDRLSNIQIIPSCVTKPTDRAWLNTEANVKEGELHFLNMATGKFLDVPMNPFSNEEFSTITEFFAADLMTKNVTDDNLVNQLFKDMNIKEARAQEKELHRQQKQNKLLNVMLEQTYAGIGIIPHLSNVDLRPEYQKRRTEEEKKVPGELSQIQNTEKSKIRNILKEEPSPRESQRKQNTEMEDLQKASAKDEEPENMVEIPITEGALGRATTKEHNEHYEVPEPMPSDPAVQPEQLPNLPQIENLHVSLPENQQRIQALEQPVPVEDAEMIDEGVQQSEEQKESTTGQRQSNPGQPVSNVQNGSAKNPEQPSGTTTKEPKIQLVLKPGPLTQFKLEEHEEARNRLGMLLRIFHHLEFFKYDFSRQYQQELIQQAQINQENPSLRQPLRSPLQTQLEKVKRWTWAVDPKTSKLIQIAWRHIPEMEREIWHLASENFPRLPESKPQDYRIAEITPVEYESRRKHFIRGALQEIFENQQHTLTFVPKNLREPQLQQIISTNNAPTQESDRLLMQALQARLDMMEIPKVIQDAQMTLTKAAIDIQILTATRTTKLPEMQEQLVSQVPVLEDKQQARLEHFNLPTLFKAEMRLLNPHNQNEYFIDEHGKNDMTIDNIYSVMREQIEKNQNTLEGLTTAKLQNDKDEFKKLMSQISYHSFSTESSGSYRERFQQGLEEHKKLQETIRAGELLPLPSQLSRNTILLLDSHKQLNEDLRAQIPGFTTIYHILKPDSNEIRLETDEETQKQALKLRNRLQHAEERERESQEIQQAIFRYKTDRQRRLQANKKQKQKPYSERNQEGVSSKTKQEAESGQDHPKDQDNKREVEGEREESQEEHKADQRSESQDESLQSTKQKKVKQKNTGRKQSQPRPPRYDSQQQMSTFRNIKKDSKVVEREHNIAKHKETTEKNYAKYTYTIDNQMRIHNKHKDANEEALKRIYTQGYTPKFNQIDANILTQFLTLLVGLAELDDIMKKEKKEIALITDRLDTSHSCTMLKACLTQMKDQLKKAKTNTEMKTLMISIATQQMAQMSKQDFHESMIKINKETRLKVIEIFEKRLSTHYVVKMDEKDVRKIQKRLKDSRIKTKEMEATTLPDSKQQEPVILTTDKEQLRASRPQTKQLKTRDSLSQSAINKDPFQHNYEVDETIFQQSRSVEASRVVKPLNKTFVSLQRGIPNDEPGSTLIVQVDENLQAHEHHRFALQENPSKPTKIKDQLTLVRALTFDGAKTATVDVIHRNRNSETITICPKLTLQQDIRSIITEWEQAISIALNMANTTEKKLVVLTPLTYTRDEPTQRLATRALYNWIAKFFKQINRHRLRIEQIKIVAEEDYLHETLLQGWTCRAYRDADPFTEELDSAAEEDVNAKFSGAINDTYDEQTRPQQTSTSGIDKHQREQDQPRSQSSLLSNPHPLSQRTQGPARMRAPKPAPKEYRLSQRSEGQLQKELTTLAKQTYRAIPASVLEYTVEQCFRLDDEPENLSWITVERFICAAIVADQDLARKQEGLFVQLKMEPTKAFKEAVQDKLDFLAEQNLKQILDKQTDIMKQQLLKQKFLDMLGRRQTGPIAATPRQPEAGQPPATAPQRRTDHQRTEVSNVQNGSTKNLDNNQSRKQTNKAEDVVMGEDTQTDLKQKPASTAPSTTAATLTTEELTGKATPKITNTEQRKEEGENPGQSKDPPAQNREASLHPEEEQESQGAEAKKDVEIFDSPESDKIDTWAKQKKRQPTNSSQADQEDDGSSSSSSSQSKEEDSTERQERDKNSRQESKQEEKAENEAAQADEENQQDPKVNKFQAKVDSDSEIIAVKNNQATDNDQDEQMHSAEKNSPKVKKEKKPRKKPKKDGNYNPPGGKRKQAQLSWLKETFRCARCKRQNTGQSTFAYIEGTEDRNYNELWCLICERAHINRLEELAEIERQRNAHDSTATQPSDKSSQEEKKTKQSQKKEEEEDYIEIVDNDNEDLNENQNQNDDKNYQQISELISPDEFQNFTSQSPPHKRRDEAEGTEGGLPNKRQKTDQDLGGQRNEGLSSNINAERAEGQRAENQQQSELGEISEFQCKNCRNMLTQNDSPGKEICRMCTNQQQKADEEQKAGQTQTEAEQRNQDPETHHSHGIPSTDQQIKVADRLVEKMKKSFHEKQVRTALLELIPDQELTVQQLEKIIGQLKWRPEGDQCVKKGSLYDCGALLPPPDLLPLETVRAVQRITEEFLNGSPQNLESLGQKIRAIEEELIRIRSEHQTTHQQETIIALTKQLQTARSNFNRRRRTVWYQQLQDMVADIIQEQRRRALAQCQRTSTRESQTKLHKAEAARDKQKPQPPKEAIANKAANQTTPPAKKKSAPIRSADPNEKRIQELKRDYPDLLEQQILMIATDLPRRLLNQQTNVIPEQNQVNPKQKRKLKLVINRDDILANSKPQCPRAGQNCLTCRIDKAICNCSEYTKRLIGHQKRTDEQAYLITRQMRQAWRRAKQAEEKEDEAFRKFLDEEEKQPLIYFKNTQAKIYFNGVKIIMKSGKLQDSDGQLILSHAKPTHAELPSFKDIMTADESSYSVLELAQILPKLHVAINRHREYMQSEESMIRRAVQRMRLHTDAPTPMLFGDQEHVRQNLQIIVKGWHNILTRLKITELETAVNTIVEDCEAAIKNPYAKPQNEVLFHSWLIFEDLMVKTKKMTKQLKETLGQTQDHIDRKKIDHKNLMDFMQVSMSYKRAVAPSWPTAIGGNQGPDRRQYAISRLISQLVPAQTDQHIDIKQHRKVSEFTQTLAFHAEDMILKDKVLSLPGSTDNKQQTQRRKQIWEITDVGIGLQDDGNVPKIMIAARMQGTTKQVMGKKTNQKEQEAVSNKNRGTHTEEMIKEAGSNIPTQQSLGETNVQDGSAKNNNQQKLLNRPRDAPARQSSTIQTEAQRSSSINKDGHRPSKSEIQRQQKRGETMKAVGEMVEILTPLDGIIRQGSSVEPIIDILNLHAIPAVVPLLTSIIERSISKNTTQRQTEQHPTTTAYFVSLLRKPEGQPELEQESLRQITKRLAQLEANTTPNQAEMEQILTLVDKKYEYAQRHAIQEWRSGYTVTKWLSYFSFAEAANNREHIYHSKVYKDKISGAGSPIFHSFRDNEHGEVAIAHPSTELVDTLNTWAGYRAFNTVDDAIACMYSSKQIHEKVQGLHNNKGLTIISSPTLTVVEGEFLGRVTFSIYLQTDGQLLDKCKQDYRHFLFILCSMPTERVIAEVVYKYAGQRPRTTAYFPFIYSQEEGWRTKVPFIASLLPLDQSLDVHQHILREALTIKWHVPSWNSDNMHIDSETTQRKLGHVQEAFYHYQTTKGDHLNCKDIHLALRLPRKNKDFHQQYIGGGVEAKSRRTQTIWNTLADARSHNLPSKPKTQNPNEYADALKNHMDAMKEPKIRSKGYWEATPEEAESLFHSIETSAQIRTKIAEATQRRLENQRQEEERRATQAQQRAQEAATEDQDRAQEPPTHPDRLHGRLLQLIGQLENEYLRQTALPTTAQTQRSTAALGDVDMGANPSTEAQPASTHDQRHEDAQDGHRREEEE